MYVIFIVNYKSKPEEINFLKMKVKGNVEWDILILKNDFLLL